MKTLIALLVLLIALLQYRLWFGDGSILEFHRLQTHIDELKQEGNKRKARNDALEAEVVDLKQGLDAIEERARQDLGMIKENETFVQIIDSKQSTPMAAEPPRPEIKSVESPPQRRRVRRNKPSETTKGIDDTLLETLEPIGQ